MAVKTKKKGSLTGTRLVPQDFSFFRERLWKWQPKSRDAKYQKPRWYYFVCQTPPFPLSSPYFFFQELHMHARIISNRVRGRLWLASFPKGNGPIPRSEQQESPSCASPSSWSFFILHSPKNKMGREKGGISEHRELLSMQYIWHI